MRASSAPGFTLIEVLVALLLSGIVAIGVHDIFGTLANGASRVTLSGEAIDAKPTPIGSCAHSWRTPKPA